MSDKPETVTVEVRGDQPMQAKTADGSLDNFYWFITQFDYDNYFQLHV